MIILSICVPVLSFLLLWQQHHYHRRLSIYHQEQLNHLHYLAAFCADYLDAEFQQEHGETLSVMRAKILKLHTSKESEQVSDNK